MGIWYFGVLTECVSLGNSSMKIFVHSQDSPDLNQHSIPKCVILIYFFNFLSVVHFFHIVGKLNVVYI